MPVSMPTKPSTAKAGAEAMAIAPLSLGLAVLCLCAVSVLILAPNGDRRLVATIWGLGLILAFAKLALVMQAPQWLDTPPDSLTYVQHAKAIWEHWQGEPVDAEQYLLKGFLSFHDHAGTGIWLPDAGLSFHSVLGTHEWIYAAYLALWWGATQQEDMFLLLAVASHAPFMAIPVAASFAIAQLLSKSRLVGLLAAAMSAFDPSAAVNGSWLLKDSLATALVMLAIWSFIVLLSGRKWDASFCIVCALGFLGAVRFVGFLAVAGAGVVVVTFLMLQCRLRSATLLAGALAAASLVFALLYIAPFDGLQDIDESPANAFVLPLQAAGNTLASQNDPVIENWVSRLETPILAFATAVARTLFAPYPWVIITDGLDWRTGTELYYPGVLFWLISLPGLPLAARPLAHRGGADTAFVLCTILFVVGAYLVVMGEWSTRQRAFLLPLLFALAAIGYADWTERRCYLTKWKRFWHVWIDRLYGPDPARSR